MYLEISPRGSGKTYRLIQHALKSSQGDILAKLNIHTPSYHQSKYILESLIKLGVNKDRIKIGEMSSATDLNYFDDFDFDGRFQALPYFTDSKGYYCTSIRKKRKLGHEDPNDFLLQLLKQNKGRYESYIPLDFYCDGFFDKLRNSYGKKDKEKFETEMANHVFY